MDTTADAACGTNAEASRSLHHNPAGGGCKRQQERELVVLVTQFGENRLHTKAPYYCAIVSTSFITFLVGSCM